MAVLCRSRWVRDECAKALSERGLPHHVRKPEGNFDPEANTIKVMTMHASKGLEFPVVALAGVGHAPKASTLEEEARLFYVAATRATHRLFVTVSGPGEIGARLVERQRA